jgi:ferredoxin
VRRLNVDGDGQGDLAGHGGEIRAVLVYQLESYQYWQKHLEQFSALPAINPGVAPTAVVRPHQPPGPPGAGPLVSFARSGVTTPWAPAHGSLLVAEACEIPTRWSCRTGVCHTCVTHLVSGEVTYTTPPLERPETGSVLVCCSEPATEVVLDL